MSIYNRTLDQLIETTCKLYLNDWWEGVTTAGGSDTTAVDTDNRNEETDFFNNLPYAELYMREGDAAGETRKISDFGAGTITVSDAFTAVTGDEKAYSIHSEYKRGLVVSAINQSIDMIAEKALVWQEDEISITLVASQYEYDIPTSFLYITRLTMADSDGKFYDAPIPFDQYKIIHTPTAQLHFIQASPEITLSGHTMGSLWANSGFVAGRKIRIEGLGSPARLTTDDSTCSITPAFICPQAAAILHMSRIRSTANDPDDHRIQYQLMQDRADIERKLVVRMQLPANCKRVAE